MTTSVCPFFICSQLCAEVHRVPEAVYQCSSEENRVQHTVPHGRFSGTAVQVHLQPGNTNSDYLCTLDSPTLQYFCQMDLTLSCCSHNILLIIQGYGWVPVDSVAIILTLSVGTEETTAAVVNHLVISPKILMFMERF